MTKTRDSIVIGLMLALLSSIGCAGNIDESIESEKTGRPYDDEDESAQPQEIGVSRQELVTDGNWSGHFPMGRREEILINRSDCRFVVEYGNVFAASYAKAMIPAGSSCSYIDITVTGWNGRTYVGGSATAQQSRGWAQATATWSNVLGAKFVAVANGRVYTINVSAFP